MEPTELSSSPAAEPRPLTDDMLAFPPAAKRFRFERDMSRFPKLSTGIVVLLSLVFAWELATGALRGEQEIMRAGALERAAVMRGEVWRVVSSINLHASSDHLIGNCLGLLFVGLIIEHAYGIAPAVLMYAVAGVVGAVFCVAFEGQITVGASGAIFGWWGAAVVFFYRYRYRLSRRDARVGWVMLVWALWTIGTGMLNPRVSNFSHLGGILAGAFLAAIVPTRITELKRKTP